MTDQLSGRSESIKPRTPHLVQTRYACGAWVTTKSCKFGVISALGYGRVSDPFAMGDDLILDEIPERHDPLRLAQLLRIG